MSTGSRACAWIAAVGLALPPMATAQDRPEREVVELIVRDGPQARAIRAESAVTRREQAARLAHPNPSFTYSREGAGFTEFFQAEQSLPIFGVRAALSDAGVAAAAAAEAERDVRLWRLRSDAAATVARVIAGQARLESARAGRVQVERLIEVLRVREKEGEGSRFDRLRAEQELREASQAVTAAAAALAEARATLSGMLPEDVPVPAIAAAQTVAQPAAAVDALMTRAATTRAELRALRKQRERAEYEAIAARRARRPDPSLFGGVKRTNAAAGRETGGVFGLTLSLPLFDRGGRDAARWEAERARVEAEAAVIESRIRSEISGAFEVLALRQAALAQEQPGAAEELAQIAEVAYREGEAGILELLDAVRTASRARTRAIELRLDARLAQIALERAVGETQWP